MHSIAAGMLAASLLFALPGLAFSYAVVPRGLRIDLRLALAPAASIATTGLAAALLAVMGHLTAVAVVGVDLAMILAFSLVGVLRGASQPIGHVRLADAILVAICAGALVTLTVVATRATIRSPIPAATTTWYYLGVADQMATAHRVPATSPEWAGQRPFLSDYLVATAHLAAWELVTDSVGGSGRTYRLLSLAALWASLWLLARAFSTRAPPAAAAAALTGAAAFLVWKFASYRPENIAFIVVLAAVFATWKVLERRRAGGWLVVTVTLGLAAFLGHAEIFTLMLAGAAAMAVARLAAVRDLRQVARRSTVVIGAVAVAGLSGYAVFTVLSGGPRWSGPIAGDPGLVGLGADPTWTLYRLIVGLPDSAVAPMSPFDAIQPYVLVPILGVRLQSWWFAFATGAATIATVEWAPRMHRRTAAQLAFGLTFAALVLLGSLLIWYVAKTYVPARVGPLRLMMFVWIGLFIAGAALLRHGTAHWVGMAARAVRSFGPTWPSGWTPTRSGRPPFVAAVALAMVTALVVVMPAAARRRISSSGISPTGLSALVWVGRHAAPGSHLLLNGYTDGVVGRVTHLNGVLDGRATYLEDPAFMLVTAHRLRSAEAFFDGQASTILGDARVDYVLVAMGSPHELGMFGAAWVPNSALMDEIARRSDLAPVPGFSFPNLRFYEVPSAASG